MLDPLLWLSHSMNCEVVAGLLRPLLEQDGQRVDRRVHGLRVGVPVFEDRQKIISAPDQPSVQPSDVLEETEWVLRFGRLHQLTRGFGDRDVSGCGASAEGADDVAGEADHFGRATTGPGHAL